MWLFMLKERCRRYYFVRRSTLQIITTAASLLGSHGINVVTNERYFFVRLTMHLVAAFLLGCHEAL